VGGRAGRGRGGAAARHATWTAPATHPVLPLLATDAGVRLQLAAGVASHRARTGSWDGGLWLPECAHAPWLDPLLEEAGVHLACVELTDVFGEGAPEHLRPQRSPAGPLLVPVDRAVMALVWDERGYPSSAAYRDTHHLTAMRHQAWAVDGHPYDPDRGRAQARADAVHFVARVSERVARGGLCVCALDTELLGHWWHEGPGVARGGARGGRRHGPAGGGARRGGGRRRGARAGPPAHDDLGHAARPVDVVRSGAEGVAWRQRAGELRVARAERPSPRAPARAARPAGVRLGVPAHPRARRPLSARARRGACAGASMRR
jgi:1,4-alpha-glucan branching enzyme